MKATLFRGLIVLLLLSSMTAIISCTAPKPSLSYSPASLSFIATQGEDNPVIQAIGIWNSSGGTLSWSVSDDAAWLNLSPTNGSSAGGTSNVIVSVDISALTAGSYTAMVTISAHAAANSPQTIPVTLTVASPPTPTPIGIAQLFYGEEGQGIIGGVGTYTYAIQNSDVTAIQGKVFLQGEPLPNWPGSEWPTTYPQLATGSILVGFNLDLGHDRWLYSQPGQVWRLYTDNTLFSGDVDVYYYVSGYQAAKFEEVPIKVGKVTILPDITLRSLRDGWVFVHENQ